MNIFRKITLKNLVKNKTRTAVTIIGIILSLSMFTAVTTCVASVRDYLINVFEERDGSWYGAVYDIPVEKAAKLSENKKVDKSVTVGNIGYAVTSSKNEYKPYIFIGEIDKDITSLLPVKLESGRLPENSSEIILPKHLEDDGEVKYSLGDVLTIDVGQRSADGKKLTQQNGFCEGETLNATKTMSFTVVGFYERPSFEPYSAAGYTALTAASGAGATCDVYLRTKIVWSIHDVLGSGEASGCATGLNKDLLRMSGATVESGLNNMIYGLAGVLVIIIMFGSVSLIYNSFSISVSERTKQFGLMKSIGATKKQMTQSVIFEAMTLCVIGIPLGILAGIAGMAVTFKYTSGMFESILNTSSGVNFGMHVNVACIVVAIIAGLITVLISAYIPSKRASRQSPIEAIHQSADINIKPRSVKTSKLTYKVFGFEGMLAGKNFKRSRKKYRTTVISLFMSVVLFITATSFCSYLKSSLGEYSRTPDYEVGCIVDREAFGRVSCESLFKQTETIASVEKAAMYMPIGGEGILSEESLSSTALDNYTPENGKYTIATEVIFVDDATYRNFLEKEKMDVAKHMNPEKPLAVFYDTLTGYNSSYAAIEKHNILGYQAGFADVETESYTYNGYRVSTVTAYDEESDSYIVTDRYRYEDENGEEHFLTRDDITHKSKIAYEGRVSSMPDGVDNMYDNFLLFIYPYSASATILDSVKTGYVNYSLYTDSPKQVYNSMKALCDENGVEYLSIIDFTESMAAEKAMSAVIEVFSYGFITLISLIAAANVFNTISTNIMLRRREFAMLKSVGMTQRGFRKMMNYECILYGVKGLAAGIPVSIGLTYLIFLSIREEFEQARFYIPWFSLAIAIGSVFLVVFATMLYSMKKISGDNPIETLKNENL